MTKYHLRPKAVGKQRAIVPKSIVDWQAGRLAKIAEKSIERVDSHALASQSFNMLLGSGVILVPSAIFLGTYIDHLLVLLVVVPLAFFLLPELRLRDRVAQRREGVERELPFFSILANVLGSAGVPLYTVFEGVCKTDVFSSIRKEALLIRRDVQVFGANPNEVFEKMAVRHPSKKFGDLLLGYTSKVRTGGDLQGYLAGESGSNLGELESAWERYAARVGIVGSLMITVFGVVPLLLLVVGFFTPSTSVVTLTVFTAVVVPLFTVLMVYLAGRMQPVGDVPIAAKGGLAAVVSVPAFGVTYAFEGLWLALAIGLFMFFTAFGLSARAQMIERREFDEALPNFMKDLMEYKRQEYDLNKSVMSIASNSTYAPAFDDFLRRLTIQVKTGTPIYEAKVEPKTRLGRLVFYVIGQMSYSGGGSLDTLFQLTKYTSRVMEMKKRAQAEIKPYLLLAHVTPLMLVFGVTFVSGLVGSSNLAFHGGQFGPTASLVGSRASLIQSANLLVVVTAASLGLVGAKISDFTVKNTLRASTNLVIATTAAAVAPLIMIGSLLGAH